MIKLHAQAAQSYAIVVTVVEWRAGADVRTVIDRHLITVTLHVVEMNVLATRAWTESAFTDLLRERYTSVISHMYCVCQYHRR